MPARDLYHNTVKNALIKDGWTITHDLLTLELGNTRLFVDLGAERVIGAEKGMHKIAVEIKTFRGLSEMKDLEQAIGQYVLYRIFLRRLEPDRELYLAVPQDVVEEVFSEEYGQGFCRTNKENCSASTLRVRRLPSGCLNANINRSGYRGKRPL